VPFDRNLDVRYFIREDPNDDAQNDPTSKGPSFVVEIRGCQTDFLTLSAFIALRRPTLRAQRGAEDLG
jgi:hypothetical protein